MIKDIPEVTSSLRVGKRVLIVTGPTKTKEIGEAVIEEFSNSDYLVELTTVKNSTMEDVLEIKEILEEYDFSIAVGGGKVIDVVKLGSFKA
ncbi:NAD(P)-dependent glycerol-1-phosphate dehydrogenase, partial [Thermococci archaeon]